MLASPPDPRAHPRELVQFTILPNAPHIGISALTGTGIDELEKQMWQMVMGGQASANDVTLITNPRHKQAIQQAHDHIVDVGLHQFLPLGAGRCRHSCRRADVR